MDIDKEYIVLQTNYRSIFHDKENIFPDEWYNIKEYDLKKKILKECIDNNILIINSSYYYEFRLIALNS
ncbi:MAG: hypothetical protein IJ501_00945 [Bacilli bacterium]|nr:hypothetical protein [Bacilli bacterium]